MKHYLNILTVAFLAQACNTFVNVNQGREEKSNGSIELLSSATSAELSTNSSSTVSIDVWPKESTKFEVLSCSISDPELPSGLSIAPDSKSNKCKISGTATAAFASNDFTVVVKFVNGKSSSTKIHLTYKAPESLTVSVGASSFSFTQRVAITPIQATISSGTISSCAISPALPVGLSLDSKTCKISGTPTGFISATTYTITATNNSSLSGSVSFSMTIAYNCQPDYVTNTGTLDLSYNVVGYRTHSSGGAWNRTYGPPKITSDCKIIFSLHHQTGGYSKIYKMNLDGTPDNTFGTAGSVQGLTGYAGGSLVMLSDGSFIAVGSSGTNLKYEKYSSAGVLDPTYNPPVHSIAGYNFTSALEGSSDGTFYIVIDHRYLRKFDATGNLDTTFGTAGTVDTGLVWTGDWQGSGLMIDSQGRVLIGGNNGTDFTLKRYSSSGVLDATFGAAGTATVTVGGTASSHISALTFTPDGKILAVGLPTILVGGQSVQYAMARFSADGILDTTFGTAGTIVSGAGGRHPNMVRQVQFDTVTGKFYVGGGQSGWANERIERFNSDGTLDTTFGTAGYYETTTGTSDGPYFAHTPWGQIIMMHGTMFSVYSRMLK